MKYKISGMDCANCATLLEVDLENIGIACKCDYTQQTLEVEGNYDIEKIKEVIQNSGYSISTQT